MAPDIVVAVVAVAAAFVAFGTHCLSCQWRFGCSIAGQLVDFGDYSDIVVGIDEFRGFVALELFVCCVHFDCHPSMYSNIVAVAVVAAVGAGSLVIVHAKRPFDAVGLRLVWLEFDDSVAFEV